MIDWNNYITFSRVLVVVTFLYSIFKLNRKKNIHRYLLVILFISFATEMGTIIINNINYKNGVNLLYSVSFIFHHITWLLLITIFPEFLKWRNFSILSFLILSILNFSFFEKFGLNQLTFIIGAFLYVMIFIIGSFNELRKDNFVFFNSNNYILLFAPILFFLGFSFMFGFRESNIRYSVIFNKIDLYTIISDFVNLMYYSLICLYIYKENKFKNGS